MVPARLRVRATVVFLAILLPALAATVLAAWQLWPTGSRPKLPTAQHGQTFHVVTITDGHADTSGPDPRMQAKLTDGTPIWLMVPPEYVPEVHHGAKVLVVQVPDVAPGTSPYSFVDFERGPPLAVLAVGFVVLVVLVARWRGLAALLGLGVGIGVVAAFTLPALLTGRSAVGVGLVSASAIMFVVLFLAHGFTLRTCTALVGTLAGLLATAGIAAWASGAAELTGLSGEYGLDLHSYAPHVQVRQVLLCGMILAGLGVLNDVTITQASAVWELHASAPTSTRRQLFTAGMRIGRDHIASTVYTIAFAYVGASLPLVLLVSMSDRALLSALGSGELAEEVARTLVGSIGLVLAIPLTTLLAALVVASPATPGHPAEDRTPQPERDVQVADAPAH